MESLNEARLIGTRTGEAVFSHSSGETEYVSFPLKVGRLSGTHDKVNILARKSDFESVAGGEKVRVTGEVRSYNSGSAESGGRLKVVILASSLSAASETEQDANSVRMCGYLCKQSDLRVTPLGKTICDIIIAVNRKHGSDYIPCIAWGRLAHRVSRMIIGSELNIRGRIQSRNYVKTTEHGQEDRTAFEISITQIEDNNMPVLE